MNIRKRLIEVEVGSGEHPTLGLGRGERGLRSSMIGGGTYFVLMRWGGTRNERSSCTLAESLHSMRIPGAVP